MTVQIAGEGLRRRCRDGGSGAKRSSRFLGAATGADLQRNVVMPGKIVQQFTNARQVALADLFHDERIGCVQDHRIAALFGLKRFQPGVHILGRKFGFQAFETTGPSIHRVKQLRSRREGPHAAGGTMGRPENGVGQTTTRNRHRE
jgi:hypothetical protein